MEEGRKSRDSGAKWTVYRRKGMPWVQRGGDIDSHTRDPDNGDKSP